MLKNGFQYSSYESSAFTGAPQQAPSQIPDHLKCGEVYTWLCAGELYAVECQLCEDHPLCPLSEFPQHMEIWHTEWEQTSTKTYETEFMNYISADNDESLQFLKENSLDKLQNDRALSFITEDSGIFETDDHLQYNARSAKIQAEHEEILEPFEQVLIEQDLTIDTTTQISEDLNEEEYFRDVNEQVAAETGQFLIENKQQQAQTFVKQNLTLANKEPREEGTTVKENEIQHLTDGGKSNGKSGLYPAENVVSIQSYINKKIQSMKRNQDNVRNEIESETSGSETNYSHYIKTKKQLKKLKPKAKSAQQKYSKLNDIKKALNKIIKDISDVKETDETENETNESENYTTNRPSKSLQGQQNAHNLTDLDTSIAEKEANLLNKQNQLNIIKHFNKTFLETNKKHFKKLQKSAKLNRTLRKAKKNKSKLNICAYDTSLETDPEQSENETFISKEQSKYNESVAEYQGEMKSSKNLTKINGNKKELKGHVKKIRNRATQLKETYLKPEQRTLAINKEETDETETEIYENSVNVSEDQVEINKNKKEVNGNKMEQNGIEMKQAQTEPIKKAEKLSEHEMKESDNIIHEYEKNNKLKENENKVETIGSETNFFNNELFHATNKLSNGKLKAIHNDIKIRLIGTSEIGTINSNLEQRLQNGIDFKAISEICLTRKRTSNTKNNKTKTNGKKTLLKLKSKNGQSGPTKCEILENCNERNLLKSEKEKIKPKLLRNRHEINQVKGTVENETHNIIPKQRIRKSLRTKRPINTLLKIYSRNQIKRKTKETNGSETCKNYNLLQNCENETLNDNQLILTSTVESTIADKINKETIFQCDNTEERNESETKNNKESRQYAGNPEIHITETVRKKTNLKDINEYESKNKMECLGKTQTKEECFSIKNTVKRRTSEIEILSSENIEETNEIETKVSFVDKAKPFANVSATNRSEAMFDNIRKSLRNIRKNPKYFENSLQKDKHGLRTEEMQHHHPFKREVDNRNNFIKNLKRKEKGTIRQRSSENSILHKTKERKTSEKEAKLEPTDVTRFEKDQKSKTEEARNSAKHRIAESKVSLRQSAKKSVRKMRCRLSQLGKEKQERENLTRKLRNCKHISAIKRKLHFRTKNVTRKNQRPNKNNKRQQVLENLRKTRKKCGEKNSSQSEFNTNSLGKPMTWYENSELRAMYAKEKNQDNERFFSSDITAVQENDQKNICREQRVPIEYKVQENATDVESPIKSMITKVYADHIASAHESNKETKPASLENNEQAKENYDKQTQDYNIIQRENNIVSARDNNEENISDQREVKVAYLENNKTQLTENTCETTLGKQYFSSKDHQTDDCSENNLITSNSLTQPSAPTTITEPISPLSPKTEEEHFEFYEPKEKLNKTHISHLIKLYQEHPRLWDQSHPDFCEPQMCRKSWQQITGEWNKYCKRKFTIAEVRIRICTLCQRFVQEKDRLALEGELDECAKFAYYEQMKFLEHQKSLLKRRELYEQQNKKILEIYQYFPILWHVRHYKSRLAKRRAEAFESISKVLKLFGLHLSSLGVQKRIRSLRKCYRLEKIRHLHAQVEQTAFNAEFRHYERMQFLDKHIDPFVCRICGKIFENLQGFREHLEAENHGSILQQDVDSEHILDAGEGESDVAESVKFSTQCKRMESFTESENSTDILQRFTPFSATPQPSRENNYSPNLEPGLPLNTPLINSWQYEDQLIEEIMENVANNDSFSQHGLDQFINSVASCEDLTNSNNLFEEVLSPSLLQADNSFTVEHPDIISAQTCSLLSPLTNAESLISVDFATEKSLIADHSDLISEHNFSIPMPAEEETIVVTADEIVEKHDDLPKKVEKTNSTKEKESQVTAELMAKKPSCSTALLVKVQCADYSVNLKLNTEPLSTLNPCPKDDSDNELYSSGDNSTAPFSDLLIHKMIEFYRKFPQLWDPNHLDFNSRTLRRQAWISLTTEFNATVCKQLCWRTLHRKLTDYAKYYKKLLTEQENYENLTNKWEFYEDFKFLDDVIAVNTELQRSVHHRDNNFKIISIYQSLPQLWNIKHPDFSKRSCKQRNIELMCNRLQEEHNLQLTTERLKNRLIELRAQYRTAKKQRLKCLKNQQQFSASEFEFYEALSFLDDHIDPFICDKCQMEFKKLTDYNQHLKKAHSQKKRIVIPPAEPGMENVCHICGIKFTTRSNLVHHIKRHEGIRNHACSMCPKKFYASHALKVHIRSHTKECPYTCEKCGISFVSASKLNQHVKRHLNQKDYECSFCPKTFYTAFEKDRHERRHLNIRDKVCPICGKTFVAGSSYYAHLMLHNDTKRFECDKCDMKFAQYPGLFKHKKRHHT